MKRFLIAAIALLFAPAALAQTPIVPGDQVFAQLEPAPVEYGVYVVVPVQQSIGTISVDERIENDQFITVSNVNIPMAGQATQDTTVLAWPTLAPISRRSSGTQGTVTLNFEGGTVTGSVDTTISENVFGPGSGRMIVRSLPFEEGYTASYTSLDDQGEVSTTTLVVSGQEEIERLDGTTTTAWLVEETSGIESATFAVDPETRQIIEIRIMPQPGVVVHFKAQ